MFVGFTSVDGANWDMVEFVTVDLPNTALTGTTATAPGGASESTARFEHFEVD